MSTRSLFLLPISLLLTGGISVPCSAQEAKLHVVAPAPNGKWELLNADIDGKLTLHLVGLHDWLKTPDRKRSPADLRLYLDGREMHGLAPRVNPGDETVEFDVQILYDLANGSEEQKREAKSNWVAVMRQAHWGKSQVPVSAGFGGDRVPFPSDAQVVLRFVPEWAAWLSYMLVFVLAIGTVYLAKKSDLLRDQCPCPAPGKRRPYSLARVQMAWWFFFVIAAYLHVWVNTTATPAISTTVLALIGISGATGLAAAMIDTSKRDSATQQRRDLATEQEALSERIAQLRPLLTQVSASPGSGGTAAMPALIPAPANSADLLQELQTKEARLTEVKASIAALPPVPAPPASGGVLKDILSEDDGISFHRFQIAVWTLVLGAVFAYKVSHDLALPDFDTTLLGLMGISSGTYLGFKFPGTK
jgi:hypothetical protein